MVDAAVSVPVIVGLLAALTFAWLWMDPAARVGRCRGDLELVVRAAARHRRHTARSDTDPCKVDKVRRVIQSAVD
jgi:hypothetical protein